MENIDNFIENFVGELNYTNHAKITSATKFRELSEWSSIIAVAIMEMIQDEYGVTIRAAEFKGVSTIGELFELVLSKL